MNAQLLGVRNTIVVIAAFAIATAFTILFLLLRQLFGPLRQLTSISADIGEGNYSVSLPYSELHEINSFIRAFDKMLERIKSRESELKASQLRLAVTLNNLVEGVVVLDFEGNILDQNPSILEMHGLADSEATPKMFTDLASSFERLTPGGDELPPGSWPIARILNGETLRDEEVMLRHTESGWEKTFRYNGGVAVDENGQRQFAVMTARDVTESNAQLQLLRQSEERFRLMTNSVKDYSIIMLDTEGRVLTWNAGAERLSGYDEKEILGVRFDRFYPEEDQLAGHPGEVLKTALLDGLFVDQGLRVRKDGTTFNADVTLTALHDDQGRHLGFVKVTRDTSEQLLKEAALRAAEVAENANRAKSEFLANMSHELRTPLNAIIGYSEIVLEDLEDLEASGDQQAATDIQRVLSSARHLLSLINDILDLAKIEAGQMDVYQDKFDVHTLIEGVVSTFENIVVGSGNSLTIECPEDIGEMNSDPIRIRQTLINLLGNAGKFTSDGHVKLVISDDVVDGTGWVQFDVHDTGIGLSPEAAESIFEPFVQADGSTARQYGGTGLGLAISKNFIDLLGGEISATSTLGEGSVFTVRLPRVIPGTIADGAPPTLEITDGVLAGEVPGEVPGDGSLILLIDDDPQARELLSLHLERDGWSVISASDGFRCVELAKQLRPAAILLDIMMPGKSGWTVLEELKSNPDVQDIPVVMCSMVDDISRGISLGAIDYLVKPVSRQELTESLGRFKRTGTGTVLIVDDDQLMRQVLVKAANSKGWNVIEAEDGKIALEKLTSTHVDVLVLDLIMPQMDGYELIRQLGDMPEFDALPIVVVTATQLDPIEKEWLVKRAKLVIESEDPVQFYRAISQELAQMLSTA